MQATAESSPDRSGEVEDATRSAAGGPWGPFALVAGFALVLGFMWAISPAAEAPEVEARMCGRRIEQAVPTDRPGEAIQVFLLLTPGWLEMHPSQPEAAARQVVVSAVGIFRGLNISAVVVGVDESAHLADDPDQLLDLIRGEPVPNDADIVMAFMGESTTRQDGAAVVGGQHLVVGAHDGHPERDAAVAAHELAHVLGASHGCDGGMPGGVMARRGFANSHLVCPCTWTVLDSNRARFSE